MLVTNTMLPSPKNEAPLETYNQMLSLPKLMEFADYVHCIESQAVDNMLFWNWKLSNATQMDRDYLVGCLLTHNSAAIRFPTGLLNSDFRRIAMNMVPLPKLNFLMSS